MNLSKSIVKTALILGTMGLVAACGNAAPPTESAIAADVSDAVTPTTKLSATSSPAPTATAMASPTPAPTPTATNTPAPVPPTPTIMQKLLVKARHIDGDENAPVTFLEFSDFK